MTFDDFLYFNRISTKQASEKLGRHIGVIRHYRRRTMAPSPEIAAAIFDWSGGQVTPSDMVAINKHKRPVDSDAPGDHPAA